ncbi:hypothetical protein [Paenibacillus sp. y28]
MANNKNKNKNVNNQQNKAEFAEEVSANNANRAATNAQSNNANE